ncbi:hypothetical protein UlMin_035804 [Ulmus minor]
MRTTIALSNPKTTDVSFPPTAAAMASQKSPWHSPVPYLFGGLAAMLGLIAFALLILACSYWRFSGRMDDGEDGRRDLESGGEKEDSGKSVKVYEEKIFVQVIMAGDENPTFLATPVCAKVSSFGDGNGKDEKEEGEKKEKEDFDEKVVKKEMSGDHHHEHLDGEQSDDSHENQLEAQS